MKNHFELGRFCAWDGEGFTDYAPDGSRSDHKYFLLANSEGDSLIDPEGVGTLAALKMICARARAMDRRTIHVIFGGSYDVNCWLKDLTPRALERVWRGGWVGLDYYRYKIQYRARRSFVIHEIETGTRVTVWDVWGFFQGTFVGALEKYGLPVPDSLRAMKKARARFTLRQQKKIVSYCQDECRLLVKLMELVREHLETAKLPIRRWDGAGACAAALLGRESTRKHQGHAPADARRAAQFAYAGGRIEMLRYGHAPNIPLHHYDIVSAYPAALRPIPSLAVGTWERHTSNFENLPEFTVYRVQWELWASASRAYPFFWRAPNGSIYYPPKGHGWYWSPELKAGMDALADDTIIGEINILEAWSFTPAEPDARPFGFIDELFLQRAKWKAEGVGAEKMIKLALNSLYGKCAQHVGGKPGEAPRYHQIEWAGWITSVTRAALFRAAQEAGRGAVMISTDGIFSTDLIPSLRVSKSLGDWEYHRHAGATVVQSGVYWLDDIDESGKKSTTDFSRGFDRGTLKRPAIVKAWKDGQLSWDASLTRFVTMGAVVNHHNKPEHWRQWRTVPRVLALSPTGTKRIDLIEPDKWKRRAGAHPAYGYIPTLATFPAAQLVGSDFSTAYPLPWVGDEPLIQSVEAIAAQFFEWEAMEAE